MGVIKGLTRNEYQRKWRSANKEKLKKHNQKYYQKNKAKCNKLSREWYQKNRHRILLNKRTIYSYELLTYIIMGFKRDWFYDKYPEFTWDCYREPAWKEKSLEFCNKKDWTCERCREYGDECHHKRNFYNNPEIALKDSNLECLCHQCHQEETNKRKANWSD